MDILKINVKTILPKNATTLKIEIDFHSHKIVTKCDRFFCFNISSTHPDVSVPLSPPEPHVRSITFESYWDGTHFPTSSPSQPKSILYTTS